MIVIVGSSELWPTPNLASKVLAIMVSTSEDIAIRSDGRRKIPSMVEELVFRIGGRIDRRIVHFEADIAGSNAGYKRDVRMVKAAREVYAFLGAEAAAIETGTGHVLEVALTQNKPVWAYGLDHDGSLLEIGHDTGHFMSRPVVNHNADPLTYTTEVTWRR